MQRILLLDIENLPQSETELLTLLNSYAFIYLVYAKSPVSLSLDGLNALSPFIEQKRLVLIKMPKSGPDSADFGLAFIAGQLSVQKPVDCTVFDVMSNDKKFEYIVDLLKAAGFQAEQKKKQQAAPVTVKSVMSTPDLNQAEFQGLSKALNILLRNQPKQALALENGLKSWLNISMQKAKQLIQQLIQYAFIRADQQALHYDLLRIRKALKTIKSESKTPLLSSCKLPKVEELQQKPHLQKIKYYCEFLNKNAASRPAKLVSLQNAVSRVLNLEQPQAILDFIQLLKKYQLIEIQNSKINYSQENILQWVNLTLATEQSAARSLITSKAKIKLVS